MKGHRIPAAGKAPPSSGPLLDPPPPAPKPSTEAAELLAHARALVAAIEEHIDKRAEEKAGPLIEAAAEKARQMVARVEESAKAEIGRLQDIAAERGKRLHEADRQRAEVRKYGIRLAYAAGLPGFTGWPSLVADIEAKLKEIGNA